MVRERKADIVVKDGVVGLRVVYWRVVENESEVKERNANALLLCLREMENVMWSLASSRSQRHGR
jgi:hypothetical protein